MWFGMILALFTPGVLLFKVFVKKSSNWTSGKELRGSTELDQEWAVNNTAVDVLAWSP